MPRAMTAGMKTELAKGQFHQIRLIDLVFSTPIYITDHNVDITWNSNSYEAGGHLIDFDAMKEAADVRLGRTRLRLSSVEQVYLALFLTNTYIDVRVLFRLALLDSAGDIIPDPSLIYEGRIEGWGLNETDKKSVLPVDLANHWSNFDKTSGRRTNTASQQQLFTGDLGMELAAETVKELPWGRAA